jgi:putative hemolysin
MSQHSHKSHLTKEYQRFIDIEAAIGKKNPRLLKIMPSFILNYIKKVIHQEELNDAVNFHSHRYRLDFADAAMEVFGSNTKVKGEENIPKSGGVIMVANHPLGGLDGVAFIQVVGKYREDIRLFVNDLLLTFKNFQEIFVPINTLGKNSVEYKKKIEEVYAGNECLLLFPAGMVSRRHTGGMVRDLVWKKSFVSKSIEHKKDVYPVYIEASNSKFFYHLGYWRKRVGIRANIEMFYLVDEMYKQRGKTISFIFGKPISWETFTPDKTPEYWSDKVKEHVYALKSGDTTKMLPTKAIANS